LNSIALNRQSEQLALTSTPMVEQVRTLVDVPADILEQIFDNLFQGSVASVYDMNTKRQSGAHQGYWTHQYLQKAQTRG
jgi:hypothetical protein